MKKAFTLIELLAVIIILAIVALVATPIILDVINDARSEANKETVYGIIQAGKNYYAESMLNNDKKLQMDGKTDIYSNIVLNGEKPEVGNLYVNEQGQVAVLVVIKDKCYKKNFYGELEELEKDNEECKANSIINDDVAPTVTLTIEGTIGNNGWYKGENVYVNMNVTDTGSGLSSYKWCSTTTEDCELTNEETSSTRKEILNGYKICVKAKDKAGNESSLECTDYLKIDTEKPSITGMEDIVVQVGGTVDLNDGVEVSDNVSGIDGSFEVNPSSIDTSEAKVVEVEYKVKDLAGNENTKTRKVIVSAAPSIEYTVAEGVINENGYANKDFFVTIKVTDNSNQGIKEIKVCTATTDRCEPDNGSVITDTIAVREITQEGDNRICVKATDNYGHTSETICSDIYKLDKTIPTVAYSILGGTYNEHKIIRVTPNDTNYSYMNIHVYKDSVGVQDKFANATTDSYHDVVLDSDGYWTIYVQVYDKAGNMQNQEPENEYDWYYQIYTIDTEKPTLELDKYTYIEGFKGWTYKNGAYEQDGIVYLPNESESMTLTPYYSVNYEYWDIDFTGYAINASPQHSPSGGVFEGTWYYNENFENIYVNGNNLNGDTKPLNLNSWTEVENLASWHSNDVKNVQIQFKTDNYWSTGPIQIKNFKIKGQLYQEFYNITVKTSDSKGIEVVKYALGEKDESYFENNGTIVTTEEVKVTENGTYTFYVKDKSGNVTIDKIVIDKIEKTSPIITAKNTNNEVIYKINNDIKTYFDINQNGVAAITQTTCINKTNGSVITNTNELDVGTHTIECSVLKANNKDAKATTTIKVTNPDVSLSKSLDTNNKYLVLKPTLELDNATYTWYKNGSKVSSNKEYTVSSTGTYKVTVAKDGFSKTSNEIVINEYQAKNDKMLIVAKENEKCVLRRNGSNEIEEFNYNEKCTITTALNMVKNGYLEYKDNTNFPYTTYNASEDALVITSNTDIVSEDYIPIDYNKTYKQSVEMKSSSQSYYHFVGIMEHDVDFKLINAASVMTSSPVTYLTKDLNYGDTVIYLADTSNFVLSSGTPYYQLGLIFWNYKDSTGFEYPELAYSRNVYHDIYLYNEVDKTNNTIKLKQPWDFGTFKAGTKLSQSFDGSTYNYGILSGESIPSTYTTYTNSLTGWQNPYSGSVSVFRYGTRYIRFLMLHNYHNTTPNASYIKNIVITEE